jgi:hypothetical protein
MIARISRIVSMLILVFALDASQPLRSQTPTIESVFVLGQIEYRVGLAAVAEGMVRAYPEIFANSPGILRIIHRTAGQIGEKIIEQVTTNHLVRDAVARHIYREGAITGLRGQQLAQHLSRGSTWRSLSNARMGSADIRVMMVVAVSAVAGFTGYQVGQELLRIEKSHASSAEAEAYSHLLGLLLEKVTEGSVRLCDRMSFASAARQLRVNMSVGSRQPFHGIACRNDAPNNVANQCSGTFVIVPNAGIPGFNQEVHSNISVEQCKSICMQRSWCKSVDYERAARRCFVQPVGRHEKPLKTDYPRNPYDHYSCAN